MTERSNSMISVNDVDLTVADQNNDSPGYCSGGLNKFCTCPKPLFTPAHACEYCWQTMYDSLDKGIDAEVCASRKRFGVKINENLLPNSFFPKVKTELSENIKPFSVFCRITCRLKRPAIFLSDRFKPFFKYFIRHIRKKIAGYI